MRAIQFVEGITATSWFELFTAYMLVLAILKGRYAKGAGG